MTIAKRETECHRSSMTGSAHIVICGSGTLGSSTARAFRQAGIPARDLRVIEADHHRCEAARRLGRRTVAADASDPRRLRAARVGEASEVIVRVSDAAVPAVVRSARRVASSARVGVGLRTDVQSTAASSAGAGEVVVPAQGAGTLLARSVVG